MYGILFALIFAVLYSTENVETKSQIRLVNGTTRYEGRVEIYHNNSWGSVCGGGFGNVVARFVCRSLGLPSTNASVYPSARFGSSLGSIWFNDVFCILAWCHWQKSVENKCGHEKDVSVRCQATQCLAVLRATTSLSHLESDVYTDRYPGQECQWILKAPGGYYISVKNEYLNYILCHRELNFYDGNSTKNRGIEFMWDYFHTRSVDSSGNYMLITYLPCSGNSKFILSYKAMRAYHTLTAEMFLKYLSPYQLTEGNSRYAWIIEAEKKTGSVHLELVDANLNYRTVRLYDGNSKRSPRLYSSPWYPSRHRVHYECNSTGRYMYLMLYTDITPTGHEFKLAYSQRPKCGRFLTAYENSSYLFAYLNESECWWTIQAADPRQTVKVEMVSADLDGSYNCKSHNITVYDGNVVNSTKLGNFCKTQTGPYSSSGTIIFMGLFSSSSYKAKEFIIRYSTVPVTYTLTAQIFRKYLSPCQIAEDSGRYACLIEAENRTGSIHLEVADANLNYRNVSLYDGTNERSPLLYRGSWNRSYHRRHYEYNSTGRYMYLTLDGYSTSTGHEFKLVFSQRPKCGRLLTAYEHSTYFFANLNQSECWWTIQAAKPSQTVEVEIVQADLDGSDNCHGHIITLYDGNVVNSTKLGGFCKTQTGSYSSSGSVIFMGLFLSSEYKAKNFIIRYRAVSVAPGSKVGVILGTVFGILVIIVVVVVIILRRLRRQEKTISKRIRATDVHRGEENVPVESLVEDFLTCGVCSEKYEINQRSSRYPWLLNCQHTFCVGCLRRCSSGFTIVCPVCRQVMSVFQVDTLNENRTVLDLLREIETCSVN